MEMSRTTDQTNDVGYIYVRTPTFDIMMVVTRQAGRQPIGETIQEKTSTHANVCLSFPGN